MLDLGWHLLGRPKPLGAFGVVHQKFKAIGPEGMTFDVEDAAFALLRFEGGKSLELSASWALNQSPRHNGTTCRVHGDKGAVEVYTPHGPVIFRNFGPKGDANESPLKLPKLVQYPAMMRHFRACIANGQTPSPSAEEGLAVMQMIDAIYKSAENGKSATIAQDGGR